MISNWLILVLAIIIVFLEYTIQKRQLGIIILHNNDHTLNKIVQYITAFFEKLEIHFNIVIIKERNKPSKRSTGKLFNIGYRQLPGMDGYLFIDSKGCDFDNFYKLLVKPSKLTDITIYPRDKVEVIDNLCGLFISRNYFKKIDGFTNVPNSSFSEFIDLLDKPRRDYGGYLLTNFGNKYHIIEKTPISSNAIRILIKFT